MTRPIKLENGFLASVSNDSTQIVDKHMVKAKGIFWYRCARKTGYLYQFDLYLGKKEAERRNLDQVFSLS